VTRFSAFASTLFLLLPTMLVAQESLTTASVTGRVLDPGYAAVSHAAVSATKLDTNQTYATETDGQGRFRFAYLPVGQYRVGALASGFAETTRQLQLTVGAAFDLTLQLSIAGTTANLQVTAQPPVVETDRSQIGETVNRSEIANLPYEGITWTFRCCCRGCRPPTRPAPKRWPKPRR
jgi:hypothetical protein